MATLADLMPQPIATDELPKVLHIEVAPEQGRGKRSKHAGALDEARTVSAVVYLPDGTSFSDELVLDVTDIDTDESQLQTRKGVAKWAWTAGGKAGDPEASLAVVYTPIDAEVERVVISPAQ